MEAKKNGKGISPGKVMNRASARNFGKRAALEDEVIELVPSLLKLKTILVPTDFSKESKKALQYAIPFARQFNARIVLLHVVQPHYVGGEFGVVDFPVLEADLAKDSAELLAALATKSIRGRLPVKTVVCSGSPANEIVDAARKSKADLIVLSTHGRTGLKHILLGSVAESVVRHAPCPVLIVRLREREFVGSEPRF